MKHFKTTLNNGEPVTVYIQGIVNQLDIPNQEPDDTKLIHIRIYDEYSNDLTDLISDAEYSRIELQAFSNV